LSPVIAVSRRRAYLGRMVRALFLLMAMAAMTLMPAAMSAAPAAAPAAAMSASTSDTGHCDSQDQEKAPGMVDCKATCGALAAAAARVSEPLPLPAAPPAIRPAKRFAGIILDIATPPPRIR
jgi:hypothetical protein